MKFRKSLTILLVVALIGLVFPAGAMAAPSVSVECTYTNEGDTADAPDLACEVYLLNPDAIGFLSAGVALNYSTNTLLTPTVSKNTTDWYLGANPPGETYMDPEVTESGPDGKVVFILGRFDSDAPSVTGVNGPRVLLGTAIFVRKTNEILTGNQATYFGISASLGRITTAPFVNFVNTAGQPQDGSIDFLTNAPIVAHREGDADLDLIPDTADNCPLIPNPLQEDGDVDGVGDACDNCTLIANGPLLPLNAGLISQRDTDGDGFGNMCDADLDNTGLVDFSDFFEFRTLFGSPAPGVEPFTLADHADFDGNGTVDFGDFFILRGFFGAPPGP